MPPSKNLNTILDTSRTWDGVSVRRMFGTDGFLVKGKVFTFLWKDALVVRLPEMPAMPGARPFAMPGRSPAPHWFEIPLPAALNARALEGLVRRAYEFAKALPPPKRAPARRKGAPR